MTTTPHILAGAALASLLPTGSASMKLFGFALGFASHYVLDAVPHWERLYGPHYNDELPPPMAAGLDMSLSRPWPMHLSVAQCFLQFWLLWCRVQAKPLSFWADSVRSCPISWTAFRRGLRRPSDCRSGVYLTRFHDWAHLDYDCSADCLHSWPRLANSSDYGRSSCADARLSIIDEVGANLMAGQCECCQM
jgi:hypothetical protein